MRKYWEVSRTYMKTQLAWRADVLFNMIFTITKILFAYLLWGVIFQHREMVGSFTFHGMLSYYIISSFLSQLEMSQGVSSEIHHRIRNGTFSKYMVLPIGIEKYFMAMELGVVLFYVSFNLMAAVVWAVVFRIRFTLIRNPWVILCAVIMILAGMIFMVQLNYFLGLLTLKYQGIGTFLMIKDNLAALITGTIVPLFLFPETVVSIMRLFPFYYVTYLPSMLLTGCCQDEAFCGVFVITGWCLAMQVTIQITWTRYRKNYEGAGM